MAAVDLAPYDARAAQIAQQQKLAQLLAQQAQAPIEVGSYKGIQAPISPYSGINKVLQSVLAAYDEKKSKSDADALTKDERDTYQKAISGDTPAPVTAPPPPQAAAPPPPAPTNGPAIAAALSGPAPQPMPTGPDPTAGPDPTQAPGNGPLIAGALSGPQPQAPPQAQPMPTLPPAPVALSPTPAPADVPPAAPPPDPMQARLAAAHASLQKARLTAAQFVGTPYAKPAAEAITSAEEQVKKLGDLQDASAQKEADRVAATNRTVHFIADVPGLDDNARKVLTAGAAADPDTAKTVVAAMVKDAFTHKLVPATPQDLQGYPQGTIAQKDSFSGKLENIYNPVPNLMAIANEKLHAQEVGLSGARLAIERHNSARDDAKASTALIDPVTLQAMASQALEGDKSVFANLGRGNQGAANIAALRAEMYKQAAQRGMKPADVARMNAEYVGDTSAARAAGTRTGAATVSVSELPGLAKLSSDAYGQLGRSDFVPFNKLQRMVQNNTASPAQARAYAADYAVVSAYARSLSPTGVPHVADQRKGEDILNNATGPQAHQAALDQIIRETHAIQSGARAALHPEATQAPTAGKVIRYDASGNRIQ